MTDKTSIEASHYDQKAADNYSELSGMKQMKGMDRVLRKSQYCYEKKVRELLEEKREGLILDYGCGTGYKNMQFTSDKWKITGIDVSSVSVDVATKIASSKKVNANYQVMDCEKMEFENNKFDVLLDFGSFSSLDMDKAVTQIVRVLRPDGALVAIETLGHNPITNLKRWLNVLRGKRTKWAAGHIMKMRDWKKVSKNFSSCEINYFGFHVIFLGLFAKHCPDFLLRFFEAADGVFFKLVFTRRFAFKTVVVLKKQKKDLKKSDGQTEQIFIQR